MTETNFDDIRPYSDAQIPAAMQRIVQSEQFPLLASYVYPDEKLDKVRNQLLSFQTIRDFQLETMRCVNEQVISRSITNFTYSGIQHIEPQKPYLFISNHRDIMLDSCLLQYILYQNGHETTQITFGANLMSSPLIIDIGKANKMFRVERGGNMKEFYKSSLHLSHYIRHVITQQNQSIWIAQRNGRTKDGDDRTDQGIIKMFSMSRPGQPLAALTELNILPIAVSYEWEPCDILKTLELYQSKTGKYTKQPGEDLHSILTGILQAKGHVHFHICQPLREDELQPLSTLNSNDYHKAVATLIDQRIHAAYHLHPNNYIAHDLLHATTAHQTHYTPTQKETFLRHLQQLHQYPNPDQLRQILLGIYAMPVENKVRPLGESTNYKVQTTNPKGKQA